MSTPAEGEVRTSIDCATCSSGSARRRLGMLLLLACPSLALARVQEPGSPSGVAVRIGTLAMFANWSSFHRLRVRPLPVA